MSDTPRTDERRWVCTDLDGMEKTRVGDWVEVDFARQLERENIDMRKVLRRIASTAGDPYPERACRNIINLVKESGEI